MTKHRFAGIAVATVVGIVCMASRALAQEARRYVQLAQAGSANLQPMTYADLERLYLDGKITAKQYQKYLNDIKSRPVQSAPPVQTAPLPTPTPGPATPPVATVPPKPQATPPPVTTTVPSAATQPRTTPSATTLPPTTPPPSATTPAKSDAITAVESKMDELLKAKAAREKAATNTPTAQSTGPRSKRDRLNDLLRLYIEGKITEPEMNERRAKIIAEPE